MTFHAFHTLSFPWPAFRPAMLINRHAATSAMRRTSARRLSHSSLLVAPRIVNTQAE
jgi:hypothetical protein